MTLSRTCEVKVLLEEATDGGVIYMGNLRKLKNLKVNYVVLRATSKSSNSRLECFPSERHFRYCSKADITIFIGDVLNVEKSKHEEHNFVFTVYTKTEKVAFIANFPDERDNWIDAIDFVKRQLDTQPDVWDVNIKDFGIANGTSISGDCCLKKTSNAIRIFKKNLKHASQLFFLSNIKRVGHLNQFILLEVGSGHAFGPGELWIEAVDLRSAKDIHTILSGCSFARPSTILGIDRQQLMSRDMTVRKSDGAEGRLRKKSGLFPFLKSRIKDRAPSNDKTKGMKEKRAHSYSDLHKLNSNQEDKAQKLLLKKFSSPQFSSSTNDVRRDVTQKSKRLSWFRDKKSDVSKSLQNLHKIETNFQGTSASQTSQLSHQVSQANNQVLRLELLYEKQISSSLQNINTMGRVSPAVHGSRLSNIKNLGMLQSHSMSDIGKHCSDDVGIARKDEPTRPLMMASVKTDRAAILRKTKWRSVDSDSPGVSSEDCSSIGSVDSYHSVDSIPPGDIASKSDDDKIADEDYMCMNYCTNEVRPHTNGRNVYMLIKPDTDMSDEQMDYDETYTSMTDVQLNDSEYANQNDIYNYHSEAEVFGKEAINYQDERGNSDVMSTRRRPPPPPPELGTFNGSSNENNDVVSPIKSPTKPVPTSLPPRARRELNYPSTSSSEQGEKNPVPLPPKVNRQLSHQSTASEGEKIRPSPKNTPHSDEDKTAFTVSKTIVGRPLPTLPRDAESKEIANIAPSQNTTRRLPAIPVGENSTDKSAKDEVSLMQMYATVDKANKEISHQNAAPLQPKCQREMLQQSTKNETGSRHKLSPPAPLNRAINTGKEQGSLTEMSSGEYEDVEVTKATEKKSKALWKDISRHVTINFKQNKMTALSPKRRSEATSHFYVDTCPIVNPEKDKEKPTQTETCDDTNSELLCKRVDLPIRPTHLPLRKSLSAGYGKVDFDKRNIYSSIDSNVHHDDNVDPISVRKSSEIGRTLDKTERDTKESEKAALTRHVQQGRTGTTRNYDNVYSEVTLKENESSVMPFKGFKPSSKEKKKLKGKGSNDESEMLRHDEDLDGSTEMLQKRPTQKILSSPTKDGKSYENISLRDEVITTPLDEIEGRPYMNLPFHKNKGRTGEEKRRSADDAAVRLLLNLQNERKIGDELSARRQSNPGIIAGKGSYDAEVDDEEVSYVNVGKDRKLMDSSGWVMTQGVAGDTNNGARIKRMNEQQNSEDESSCMYENVAISPNGRHGLSSTPPMDLKAQTNRKDDMSKSRDNTQLDANPNEEMLYSNIGFAGMRDIEQNKRYKPVPKPRPKKPERRKISQTPSKEVHTPSGASTEAQYDEVSFSPKPGYVNILAGLGISENSYVNIGSSGYHDSFDIGRSTDPSSVSSKSQNMVNDFQPRQNRKQSEELTYTDVTVVRGRDQSGAETCVINESYYAELASPDAVKKSNQRTNTSQCKYTMIDFKKSHGMSEAVRETRVGSLEGNAAD